MNTERDRAPAEKEQIDVLMELMRRARAQNIKTGIRDDELEDLSQPEAAELIEQLQTRLGQTRG